MKGNCCMKKRNMRCPTILVALACLLIAPVAQSRQQSEDRGNGNSAAENVDALNPSTTGSNNTAHGWFSLFSNTTGSSNTADGFQALYGNTTGFNNTAVGFQALFSNTGTEFGDAAFNTALGSQALYSNTTGFNNTANGVAALLSNTVGYYNTATGSGSLYSNTTGSDNTANGANALVLNTTGSANTANGDGALFSNTTGNFNTATGLDALSRNSTGSFNTANGLWALFFNTSGSNNTAIGEEALYNNTTGGSNTAFGYQALFNNTTGSYNVALEGGSNLTTGDFNIDIGNDGVAGESGTIRIGSSCCQSRTYIAGIWGVTYPDQTAVYVNPSGALGVALSSARFKRDIQNMDRASEAILALKPVMFHYKSDNTGRPQFGLIAEEVAAVNPDLVLRDENGEPYSVRYEQINAMLLNEFLKEHRKVEAQEATIAELMSTVADQQKSFAEQKRQIEALASGLQKVSARVELSKFATGRIHHGGSPPQVVMSNPESSADAKTD